MPIICPVSRIPRSCACLIILEFIPCGKHNKMEWPTIMMTRADAEWLLEALKSAGLTGEIIGSLAVKKQSSHDIDLTIAIGHPRDYQTYWHTLERLGFRYERTDAAPSGEIWVGRSRDGTTLVVDVHPNRSPSPGGTHCSSNAMGP
jgi:hypothetical protein